MGQSIVQRVMAASSLFRPDVSWWVAATFAGLLAIVPLFLVDVPPLEDYPNHLARAYVLVFGAQDPFLSRMYEPSWHVVPNLGMDLIVPPFLRVLPLHVVGRAFLGLVLLLQFVATLALHRAIHRRRSWWPLASCLILYNGLFLRGYLNFLLGTGAALLVAAWWTQLWQRRPGYATAILTLGAMATFFAHLLSFAFLELFVSCTVAEDFIRLRQQNKPRGLQVARGAAMVAASSAIPSLLYFMSRLADATGEVSYASLAGKLLRLNVAVLNYHRPLDVATSGVILSMTGLCLLYGLHRRTAEARPRTQVLPARILLAISILLLLWSVLPSHMKNLAWVDTRFPFLATILLFAGLNPPELPRRLTLVATALVAGLFLVRTGVLAKIWFEHRQLLVELRQTIAPVIPGSRVLVARVDPQSDPDWWHSLPANHRTEGMGSADDYISALLIPERSAFWPLLFTDPAQQPLRVLPEYGSLSASLRDPADYRLLLQPNKELDGEFAYLKDWQRHFDYVLMINPSGAPDLATLLPILDEVARSPVAVLYRNLQRAG